MQTKGSLKYEQTCRNIFKREFYVNRDSILFGNDVERKILFYFFILISFNILNQDIHFSLHIQVTKKGIKNISNSLKTHFQKYYTNVKIIG